MRWIFLVVVIVAAVALIALSGPKRRRNGQPSTAVRISDAGIVLGHGGAETLHSWRSVLRVELALRSRAKAPSKSRAAWRMWPLTPGPADSSPSSFRPKYSFVIAFDIDEVTGIRPDPIVIAGGSGEDVALLAHAFHLPGFEHTVVLSALRSGRTATVTCFQR